DGGGDGETKVIAIPANDSEITDPPRNAGEEEEAEPSGNTSDNSAPLIPDLLSWDEPDEPQAPELEKDDPFALPTATTSATTNDSEVSVEPSGWELALVPSSDTASTKGIMVLDRSTLDSLYDAALVARSTNDAPVVVPGSSSSNPFQTDDDDPYGGREQQQQMFYDPGLGTPQQQYYYYDQASFACGGDIMQQQQQQPFVDDGGGGSKYNPFGDPFTTEVPSMMTADVDFSSSLPRDERSADDDLALQGLAMNSGNVSSSCLLD
ncbi:hypothetical protein M569_10082, partial [Genlisea aurea]